MKLSRKPVSASTQETILCEGSFDSAMFEDQNADAASPAEEVAQTGCQYSAACEHIHAAINSLADCAKEDQHAREAIANLSVVLLDLKA